VTDNDVSSQYCLRLRRRTTIATWVAAVALLLGPATGIVAAKTLAPAGPVGPQGVDGSTGPAGPVGPDGQAGLTSSEVSDLVRSGIATELGGGLLIKEGIFCPPGAGATFASLDVESDGNYHLCEISTK
jgi:hypothetical protein